MMVSRRVMVIVPRATDTDEVVVFTPCARWVQIGGRATNHDGDWVLLFEEPEASDGDEED